MPSEEALSRQATIAASETVARRRAPLRTRATVTRPKGMPGGCASDWSIGGFTTEPLSLANLGPVM